MNTFADNLKELRKSKKVTQKQMADFLQLTERNYQRYEAGQVDPPTSTTEKLADYFDVSIDYLLGRKNYWQDTDGNINVKVPLDIFNLDTDALKKKLDK